MAANLLVLPANPAGVNRLEKTTHTVIRDIAMWLKTSAKHEKSDKILEITEESDTKTGSLRAMQIVPIRMECIGGWRYAGQTANKPTHTTSA